ncbi:hypothetical protein ESA94_20460 [Lacibacter luteus]|uniref:Uncharacterized protein n=1 Tax=Lacibacter luteus TaxID=2508719 RepID=A0A4Q1CDC2_9BACT|nr:hypothetical protein [Lacibacter luteus]RXK57574.1 hypothetical protein ESA94_20460 [Lacibacter luteus]
MALSNARLKGNLKTLFENMEANGDTRDEQLDWFCGELAKVLIDEIKELRIQYSAGLVAPSGGGAVTGTITHTVN